MKETNMEHFRGEAEERKYDFGKRKDSSTGKEHLISCVGVNCRRCDFYTGNNMDDDLFNCSARKIKWLMSEYKPEPVLTAREKHFVEFLQTGYITRDENGESDWHEDEPYKNGNAWYSGSYIVRLCTFIQTLWCNLRRMRLHDTILYY